VLLRAVCRSGLGFIQQGTSEAEVINDINSDIVTLYRVIRFHLREFIEHFKWLLCAL
jgi:DNA adenine methylase